MGSAAAQTGGHSPERRCAKQPRPQRPSKRRTAEPFSESPLTSNLQPECYAYPVGGRRPGDRRRHLSRPAARRLRGRSRGGRHGGRCRARGAGLRPAHPRPRPAAHERHRGAQAPARASSGQPRQQMVAGLGDQDHACHRGHGRACDDHLAARPRSRRRSAFAHREQPGAHRRRLRSHPESHARRRGARAADLLVDRRDPQRWRGVRLARHPARAEARRRLRRRRLGRRRARALPEGRRGHGLRRQPRAGAGARAALRARVARRADARGRRARHGGAA